VSAEQAALALAKEFELPLLPRRPDKKPYLEHGFKDASTNLEQRVTPNGANSISMRVNGEFRPKG
jgi:hypothetical protein